MKFILRIAFSIGVIYNVFVWYSQVKLEKENQFVNKEIKFIDCNSTKSSIIKIKHLGKYKRVGVGKDLCRKLEMNQNIKLVHIQVTNSFYFPKNRGSTSVAFVFLALFLATFFNLKNIVDKAVDRILEKLN